MNPLVRALYDIPAFRGTTTGGDRGRWFSANPRLANEFAMPEGQVIPAQLNAEGFAQIENIPSTKPLDWNSIPLEAIRDPRLQAAVKEYLKDWRKRPTTDEIAVASQLLGLPGVTFHNTVDEGLPADTQYFVNDLSRRRSRFAKFEDPNSEDIMAALLLSLLGIGSAAQQEEDPTDA